MIILIITTKLMLIHGFHSQGNIIFQDISKTKLPFSRTFPRPNYPKYTRFKGNKLRYVRKSISYLFSVWSILDIFYGTTSSLPLLAVWSTHFYVIFNWHGLSRLCTCIHFLQQTVFFHRHNIYSQVCLF